MKIAVTIFITIFIVFSLSVIGLGKFTKVGQKEEATTAAPQKEAEEKIKVTTPATTAPKATTPTPAVTPVPKAATPTATTPKTPTVVTPAKTTLTTTEVSKHNAYSNCWIILNGNVYNISTYINSHTGGVSHITCGTDQTTALHSKHGTAFDSFFNQNLVGALGTQI
jgi:cytochrome b involved in lipid metabolism